MFTRKSVRTTFATVAAAAVAASTVALAGPASAAADPDDTAITPVAGDLITVGSDTSQHALHLLEGAWNGATPAPSFRIASFAATGGGEITLPGGTIKRPNGSGAGKGLLYGAGNNADIDFARSSSALNTAEKQAGLQQFPFALDTLAMAVSNTVASNAPASLTPAQIVGIYDGSITNWSEVGGKPGAIAPKIPQAGSGTRSFFVGQLKAMNGGVDVALAASVAEVQEHDDTDVKSDPNAIAPFSTGRASLLGPTLRIEQGWKADRALYNVVRGTDLARADIQAVLGEDGFFCSTDARDLIEQAGFEQLATPARGGVCGEATQEPTTNFVVNEAVVTETALTATSAKPGSATLVAAVSGSSSPEGTVSFYEGDTLLQAGVPLVSGRATYTATGVTPGAHTYRAAFLPAAGSVFEASEATASVTVKTKAKVSETFPATVAKGKRAKGTVTVTIAGGEATGVVKVVEGGKTLGSGRLAGGKATITLKKLAKGKHTLTAVWAGNDLAARATKKFTIVAK